MGFAQKYIHDTRKISEIIDPNLVEEMAEAISNLKKRGGRLFFIGSGGGAGHASHAVCDFRKISNL